MPNERAYVTDYDVREERKESKFGPNYKWIVLSNTTIGALMGSIDGSILMISLPAIFNGLGVNPLIAGNVNLLLWLLTGYTIMSCVSVVAIGRLSDMFGRVRLYNLGFALFTIASILIYASSYLIKGDAGIMSITLIRLLQALGSSFLFTNSAAILTDAFPPNERGKAMGFNQIAFIGGSVAGSLIGGVLAAVDWHLIFLISVPVGIIGTVWAYVALHEIATIRKNQHLDIVGNVVFAAALLLIVIAVQYGLEPYGSSPTGWGSPFVLGSLAAGIILLPIFVLIERREADPMFRLWLFKIRDYAAGNASMLLSGIARGGLQFMLTIWLQGIWLPLHGISFENTPFQAAICMLPLVGAFLVSGPLSGYLSDRYGARRFTTAGMLLSAIGFVALSAIPANFNFATFAVIIFVLGLGQGLFASPNMALVMNSVPPEHRGVSSGMRATLLNLAFMLSLVIFFSLLVVGVSGSLPKALYDGLIAQNVSNATALKISHIPSTTALFAALLGDNPMKAMLNQSVISTIPKANADYILGNEFFPTIMSKPFTDGMKLVLGLGALLSLVAAVFSALPSRKYTRLEQKESMEE